MKRSLVAAALAAIFLFVAIGASYIPRSLAPVDPVQNQGLRRVELKGQGIRVSVADTESARQQGLSGRTGLEPDEGMLFVFPQDGIHAFWMKDMRFSIDMLWLSNEGAVVYMAQNVSPDTYPQRYQPDVPARYVLELPAGYVEAHAVRVGDIVRL